MSKRRLAVVVVSLLTWPGRCVFSSDALHGQYEEEGMPSALAPSSLYKSSHLVGIFRATFSSDGRWIATAGKGNTIKVWDAQTGSEIKSISGGGSFRWFSSLEFVENKKILAFAVSGEVQQWAPNVSKDCKTSFTAEKDFVETVVVNRQGKMLATYGCSLLVPRHGGKVRSIKDWDLFSVRRLRIGNLNVIRVWDVSTGKQLEVLQRKGLSPPVFHPT